MAYTRNGFSRIGGTVYTCSTCNRRTRNTGAQSIGSDLCPQCYELAGIENDISDGYSTIADRREQTEQLFAEIADLGGDARDAFSALWQD